MTLPLLIALAATWGLLEVALVWDRARLFKRQHEMWPQVIASIYNDENRWAMVEHDFQWPAETPPGMVRFTNAIGEVVYVEVPS